MSLVVPKCLINFVDLKRFQVVKISRINIQPFEEKNNDMKAKTVVNEDDKLMTPHEKMNLKV